jgi:subtilase family serine protease
MQGIAVHRRLPHLFTTSLALLALFASVAFASMSLSASAHNATMAPDTVRVNPQYIYAGKAQAGATFGCQSPSASIHCYGPTQIRNAYDIQPVLNAGITGKGRTIVIIDAFQSPTIQHDLQLFDATFGLPDPKLNIIQPFGVPPFDINDPNQTGWAGEITLDVEWSHAVAPDATIDLVEASSNNDQDLYNVTKYAVDHRLGDVISQSFGEGEICMDPAILHAQHQLFFQAALEGISVFASAGDNGAAQPTCDGNSFFLSASTPASDPLVTGVGGTSLTADLSTGQYGSETTWNEPDLPAGGGGGFSTIYAKPFYQYGTAGIGKFRGVPDVAYNAAVNGGVLAVFSSSGQGADLVFIFGGTSAGSPQWAGITALGAQKAGHSLGFLNPALYAISHNNGLYNYVFHDITTGNNTFTGQDVNGNSVTVQGYSADRGWDPTTGLGSPDVAHMLSLLPSLSASTQSQIANIAH